MKLLIAMLLAVMPFFVSAQQLYGAGVSYVNGVPSYTPNFSQKASELCVSLNRKMLYLFNRDSSEWKPIGGITVTFGAPIGAPEVNGGTRTAINMQNGLIYWWTGTAWREIISYSVELANVYSVAVAELYANQVRAELADSTATLRNYADSLHLADNDRDSTNELQNLVLLGTVLNITDGNAVDFASLLSNYLLETDTTALLAAYVTTAGFGLLKSGKTQRVDSSKVATRYYVGTNPTSIAANAIVRSNGSNLVAANMTDNASRIVMGLPMQLKEYSLVGLPTGVTKDMYWVTGAGPAWYQGARVAYALESSASTFPPTRLLFIDGNGQAGTNSTLSFSSSTNTLTASDRIIFSGNFSGSFTQGSIYRSSSFGLVFGGVAGGTNDLSFTDRTGALALNITATGNVTGTGHATFSTGLGSDAVRIGGTFNTKTIYGSSTYGIVVAGGAGGTADVLITDRSGNLDNGIFVKSTGIQLGNGGGLFMFRSAGSYNIFLGTSPVNNGYKLDVSSTTAIGLPRGNVGNQPAIVANTTPLRFFTDTAAIGYGNGGVYNFVATRPYVRTLVNNAANIGNSNLTLTGNRTLIGGAFDLRLQTDITVGDSLKVATLPDHTAPDSVVTTKGGWLGKKSFLMAGAHSYANGHNGFFDEGWYRGLQSSNSTKYNVFYQDTTGQTNIRSYYGNKLTEIIIDDVSTNPTAYLNTMIGVYGMGVQSKPDFVRFFLDGGSNIRGNSTVLRVDSTGTLSLSRYAALSKTAAALSKTLSTLAGFATIDGSLLNVPIADIQDGNGLISALPLASVTIDAQNNALGIIGLNSLYFETEDGDGIIDLTNDIGTIATATDLIVQVADGDARIVISDDPAIRMEVTGDEGAHPLIWDTQKFLLGYRSPTQLDTIFRVDIDGTVKAPAYGTGGKQNAASPYVAAYSTTGNLTEYRIRRDTFVKDTLFSVGSLLSTCQELYITAEASVLAGDFVTVYLPAPSTTYANKRVAVYVIDASSSYGVVIDGTTNGLYYSTNTSSTAPAAATNIVTDSSPWTAKGATYEFTCTRNPDESWKWKLNQH